MESTNLVWGTSCAHSLTSKYLIRHAQSIQNVGSANIKGFDSSISKVSRGVYLRSHELAGNTGSGGRSEQCHVSRDAHTRISAREAGEKAITTKKNREFLFFAVCCMQAATCCFACAKRPFKALSSLLPSITHAETPIPALFTNYI